MEFNILTIQPEIKAHSKPKKSIRNGLLKSDLNTAETYEYCERFSWKLWSTFLCFLSLSFKFSKSKEPSFVNLTLYLYSSILIVKIARGVDQSNYKF